MRRTLRNARALLAPAALLALLAAPLGACREAPEESAISAPPVMVEPVRSQRIVDRIEATGQLLAEAEASVAAQVDGQVTEMHVDEGDAVEEGQTLLEIDPERRQLELANARARLAEFQAQVEEGERELGRIELLHARGATSEQRLDEARTNVRLARSRRDAAEAQLRLAERSVADSTVTAPFPGLVARRHVSRGEFVAPGAALLELVALDPVEVEFFLPERDSARVRVGHPVEVRVAPYPDEVFRAEVTTVSPTIDPVTRTLRVKAELPNPEGRLRPGLFARVDLGVAEREAVAMIPEEAVLQRADGSVAFRLVDENRVERRNVRLGVYRDGLVEVREGLAPGDRVVVRGQTALVDGAVVSLRDAEGRPVGPDGARVSTPATTARSDSTTARSEAP